MTGHRTATREEWLGARLQLLDGWRYRNRMRRLEEE